LRRFADAASLACLSQMSSRPASDVRNDRGVLDVASELVSDAYDRNLARRSRHSPRLLPSGLTTRIVEPPRTQMVVRSLGRTESARLHKTARGTLFSNPSATLQGFADHAPFHLELNEPYEPNELRLRLDLPTGHKPQATSCLPSRPHAPQATCRRPSTSTPVGSPVRTDLVARSTIPR